MDILGVVFEYLGYDWCPALGWWLTILGMLGVTMHGMVSDRPMDGG